jgi:hypothetical protein
MITFVPQSRRFASAPALGAALASLVALSGCAGGLSGLKERQAALSEDPPLTTLLDRLEHVTTATQELDNIMSTRAIGDGKWAVRALELTSGGDIKTVRTTHANISKGFDYRNPKVRVLPIMVAVELDKVVRPSGEGSGLMGGMQSLGGASAVVATQYQAAAAAVAKVAAAEAEVERIKTALDDAATPATQKAALEKELAAAKDAVKKEKDASSKVTAALEAAVDKLEAPAGKTAAVGAVAKVAAYASALATEAKLARDAILLQVPNFLSTEGLKKTAKHVAKKMLAETVEDAREELLESFLAALGIEIEVIPQPAIVFKTPDGNPLSQAFPKIADRLKERVLNLAVQVKTVPARASTVATKLGFLGDLAGDIADKMGKGVGVEAPSRMERLVDQLSQLEGTRTDGAK